jgi:hypothetical protein
MFENGPPKTHLPSTCVVILGALVLALPWIYTGIAHNDEYGTLSNGLRIAQGQLQYRDYFYAEPPLTHWMVAIPYLLFGPSVVAARWGQQLMLVLAAWQSYRIGRWLGAGPWAAILPAWLTLGCFYALVPVGVNHHWLVLPFCLATLLAGLRAAESARPRAWAIAGVWAGLTLTCLQSDGAVVTVAIGLYALMGGWLAGDTFKKTTHQVAAFGLGWALPVGAVLAVLWLDGTLAAAYGEVIISASAHYRTPGNINDIRFLTDLYRAVPPLAATRLAQPAWYLHLYTYLATTLVPVLVALCATAWGLGLAIERIKGHWVGPLTRRFGLIGISSVGFLLLALHVRADVEHQAFYATPAFVLVGALAAHALATVKGAWRIAACLPTLGLALLLAGGLATASSTLTLVPRYLLTLGGADMRAREDATLAYLHAHARPGDRMVAVPAGGYYYYYGLPPAVHMSSIYSRAAKFIGDDELDAFWHEVATCQARYLVVDTSDEPFMHDAFPGPPAGYKPVYQAPSLRNTGPWVTVYERRQ